MSIGVKEKTKKIKCVVWDLDNTLWDGILSEDTQIYMKENVLSIIEELDSRGILQSISSKNDRDIAINKLKEFGIEEYFIYPQINWGPKSDSINKIAESINIGLDSIAFIDDQTFELEEVKFSYPEVSCIDASKIYSILEMDEMKPLFITEDSKKRRILYMNDIERNKFEENFNGTKEEFLASLNMKLKISKAREEDLKRVEELTVRTNQLNTTGYTYSIEELEKFIFSSKYNLLVVGLDDKFGTYGKIGLVLLEIEEDCWTINLFIMSCRVISRGVGNIVLKYILNLAKDNNVKLKAKFVPTSRNKMMYITYKFAGFIEIEKKNDFIILENELLENYKYPYYVEIED